MTAPDLLNCPFCGGPATHAKTLKGWKVECEGRMGSCTMNARTHYQPTKWNAYDAWNTRAPLAEALAVPTDGVATLAEALEARVKQRGMGLGRAFTIRDLDLMDKAAAALRAIGERADG